MSRNIVLNDPFFNEFVYHCIVSSSIELRNKLPTAYLRHTTTKVKIKRFSEKASLEQKIEMLSRLGVSFSAFFSVPEHLTTDELRQSYQNYKAGENYDSLNDMIKKRQFVFCSRDIMAILGIMGQICHSNTYMINREYSSIATDIANFGDTKKVRDREILRQVMEDHKMIVKFLLFNLTNQSFVDSQTGYKAVDLMVLMFLFLRMDGNTTTFTSCKKIQEYFKNIYTARIISTVLRVLHKNMHIERFPGRMDYGISALGIQALHSYISRLVSNTLSR